MIGMIVGGAAELLLDLLVQDKKAARAAKAAAWSAVAGASAGLDGGMTAAAYGIMAAGHAVNTGIDDATGQGVVDTSASVMAGGMTSWLALAKVSGGAAVGGAIGAGADGADGATKGMSMGSSVTSGIWVENAMKAGGGLAGGAIGAASADEKDRAQAFELGFGVGTAVGGVAGATWDDPASMEARAELDLDSAKSSPMRGAVVQLAAEAAAPLVAAAMSKDGRFLEKWSDVQGAVRKLAAGVSALESVVLEGADVVDDLLLSAAPSIAVGVADLALAQEPVRPGSREQEASREKRKVAQLAGKLVELGRETKRRIAVDDA